MNQEASSLFPEPLRGQRILRLREVVERTGLSSSTIWRLERRAMFPRRRQIAPARVGWLESEIDAYIAGCPPSGILRNPLPS